MNTSDTAKIDVIGDVHGYFDNLLALGEFLGYAVRNGWSHPDNRTLIFLGDLIDRGPNGMEVARLVLRLVQAGRAICLMGNHEYNLLEHYCIPGGKIRTSNRDTILDVDARRSHWEPLLSFFRSLDMAAEIGDLQVVHAYWNARTLAELERRTVPLGAAAGGLLVYRQRINWDIGAETAAERLYREHCEELIKGPEVDTAPYPDADGQIRDSQRIKWWETERPPAGTRIFGHYWNIPPQARGIAFNPRYLTTEPGARNWYEEVLSDVGEDGMKVSVPPDVRTICVDYSGINRWRPYSCVGAYRWPEHEVAFRTFRLGA